MTEKVWMLNTRIDKDTNTWSMTPSDAVELANSLIVAAEESVDYKEDRTLAVGGSIKTFKITIKGDLQTVKLQKALYSKLKGNAVPHEGFDARYSCAKCGGFLKTGWFGIVKGCLTEECENYFRK